MADEQRPGAEQWVPAAATIPALRTAATECRGCELWRDATQVVFSAGSAKARLLLIGEQPGDREDREGEPFIGPAGRVLDDALRAAHIDRGEVYLTNAVKHFRNHPAPRGKRRIHDKPGVVHIQACHPWLDAELAVVKPEVIVCLGATAGRAVLGRPVRIRAERDTMLDAPSGSRAFGVLLTMHPSALLRLREREGWDEAFAALVADLTTARLALR